MISVAAASPARARLRAATSPGWHLELLAWPHRCSFCAMRLPVSLQTTPIIPSSRARTDRSRRYAAELVAFMPDVILASGGSAVGPLLQVTRTVPIVFTQTPDPVGAGFVASLARPGGNATGFTSAEYGMGAKWLELLKEIAPRVSRAAVLRDPVIPQGTGQWGAIQSVAPSFGLDLRARSTG
jgi:ABC-type uncharacterized transport system substrate-binding protein